MRGLDRHDIDDIAQVVGVIVTQRLRGQDPPPLETRDDLARYVFRIARNYKIAWHKEKSRERLKAIEGELGKRTRQSGERTAEEVLRELSDEQREAILSFLPDDKRKLRDVMALAIAEYEWLRHCETHGYVRTDGFSEVGRFPGIYRTENFGGRVP